MKALSIRQPWAWAILNAGKRIENRSRKDGRIPDVCRHRGPLLVHASKGCTDGDWYEAATWMRAGPLPPSGNFARSAVTIPLLRDLPRGGIIGQVDAWAHINPDGRVWHDVEETREMIHPEDLVDLRWWTRGHGLLMQGCKSLPFVPWKGQLGLFDVPESALGMTS